jgi:hypothetical protein
MAILGGHQVSDFERPGRPCSAAGWYNYTRLDTYKEDVLRLVYVRPKLRDGLIECNMHHLDTRARYASQLYSTSLGID